MSNTTGYAVMVVAACIAAGCGRRDETSATRVAETNDYVAMIEQARTRSAAEAIPDELTKAVRRFQADTGRLPMDLNELVAQRYLPGVPIPPAGFTITYDPQLGNVTLQKEPEASGVNAPPDVMWKNRLMDQGAAP
jgi:hypothetical protein